MIQRTGQATTRTSPMQQGIVIGRQPEVASTAIPKASRSQLRMMNLPPSLINGN